VVLVALVVPHCGSYNERVVPNGYNLALARDEEGKERMGKKKELGRDSGQRTAGWRDWGELSGARGRSRRRTLMPLYCTAAAHLCVTTCHAIYSIIPMTAYTRIYTHNISQSSIPNLQSKG
jgi:hypothetical protein